MSKVKFQNGACVRIKTWQGMMNCIVGGTFILFGRRRYRLFPVNGPHWEVDESEIVAGHTAEKGAGK